MRQPVYRNKGDARCVLRCAQRAVRRGAPRALRAPPLPLLQALLAPSSRVVRLELLELGVGGLQVEALVHRPERRAARPHDAQEVGCARAGRASVRGGRMHSPGLKEGERRSGRWRRQRRRQRRRDRQSLSRAGTSASASASAAESRERAARSRRAAGRTLRAVDVRLDRAVARAQRVALHHRPQLLLLLLEHVRRARRRHRRAEARHTSADDRGARAGRSFARSCRRGSPQQRRRWSDGARAAREAPLRRGAAGGWGVDVRGRRARSVWREPVSAAAEELHRALRIKQYNR